MNYGYDSTSARWHPYRKRRLATKLVELCARDEYLDAYKMRPYVEVDGLYPGVRIRRITHLAEEARSQLLAEADAIYVEVMAE